jgi:intein/homing endonuclease
MALTKGLQVDNFFDDLVQDLEFEFAQDDSASDIMDFLNREVDLESWLGPGGQLNDRQIALLKVYDGLELDEKETALMQAWAALDRTTYDINLPPQKRQSFILECGRSGGKCKSTTSLILSEEHGLIYGYEALGQILEIEQYSSLSNNKDVCNLVRKQKLADVALDFKQTIAIEGKSKKAQANALYVKGDTKTKRILTSCGYNLEATPEHRVKVLTNEGVIDWKYLGDIETGDYVALHRNTKLFPSKYLTVDSWAPSTRDVNTSNQKDFNPPQFFTADWGYLMGLLVSDGLWTQPTKLQVSCHSDDVLSVIAAFDRCGLDTATGEDKRSQYGRFVTYYGKEIREYFHHLGYNLDAKSDTKSTPWSIRRSPKDVQASYLSGLFDGDGSVESGGRKVTLSTASKTLATETQLLLLNFGLVSSVQEKYINGSPYYILSLRGRRSLRLFASEIGFNLQRKQQLLVAYLESHPKDRDETEAIPYQKEWLQRLREYFPDNKGMQPGSRQALTSYDGKERETLRNWRMEYRSIVGNCIKDFSSEHLSSHRLTAIIQIALDFGLTAESCPELKHLQDIADCDYFYDPVVSVEDSEAFCVDLSVPGHEQYVCQGMTNHNTFLGAIIIGYEFYKLCMLQNPQQFFGVAASTLISIYCLAPAATQVKKTIFGQAKAFLNYIPKIKRLIDNKLIMVGEEQIKYDEKLLYIYAGNSKGSSQVGSRVILLVMDEVARFENKDGDSNALELWSNVGVSGITFGEHARRLAVSSAWLPGDAIQKLYIAAKGDTSWAGFRLKTWDLNPKMNRYNPIIASEYNLNPASAKLEFEGDRSANNYGFFYENEVLEAFIGRTVINLEPAATQEGDLVKLQLNSIEPGLDVKTYMHLDPAFVHDAYGLAFGHGEVRDGEKVVYIDGLAAWEPEAGSVVSIMNVYDIIFAINRARPIYKVTTDHAQQHETIQRLRMQGISASSRFWSNRVQVEIYDFTRKLFHEKRIILPKNSPWTTLLKSELMGITHDKDKNKIVHSNDSSKDLLDCVCSVAWEIAGAPGLQQSLPKVVGRRSQVSKRYSGTTDIMKDDSFGNNSGRKGVIRSARTLDSSLFEQFDF